MCSANLASANYLPQASASFRNTWVFCCLKFLLPRKTFRNLPQASAAHVFLEGFRFSLPQEASAKLPQASATHELLDVWNSWFVTKIIKLCQETTRIHRQFQKQGIPMLPPSQQPTNSIGEGVCWQNGILASANLPQRFRNASAKKVWKMY